MRDSIQGQQFLEAFIGYIDFRFRESDSEVRVKTPPGYDELMSLFKELLSSRPGGDPKRDIYQDLVANMGKMKDTRGGGNPPPGSGEPR